MNIETSEKDYKKFLAKARNRRPDVKEKLRKQAEVYREKHPDRVRATNQRFYEKHRAERINTAKEYNKRSCRDPILNDVVTYTTLMHRIRYHPDLYGDITPGKCLIHVPTIKGLDLLTEEQKEKLDVNN